MANLTTWKEKAERLASRARRVREQSAAIGERAMGGAAAVGAGYATGVAIKKWGDKPIPNTEVPMIPAFAGAVALVGVAGMAGKGSDVAAAAGSSALGAYLAVKTVQAK